MKRLIMVFFALSGLLALATASSALATVSPLGIMTPGVYSPAEGVPGAPAGTCAAEPEKPECPTVSKIVVSAPEVGINTSEYGPSVAEHTTTPDPAAEAPAPDPAAEPAASGADICGVYGRPPNVTPGGNAHTRAENSCYYGYGVEYTELLSALEKQQFDGSVQWRGSDTTKHWGAGTSYVDHYAGCNGRTEFNWLGYAYAYTVINGTAYSQSNGNWRRIPCN